MKHISGRKKLVPLAGLTTGRYRQLRVTEGEPSLGFVTEKTLPLNEDYYQLVTFGEGEINQRYWQVAPAGIITGISIFRNNSIIGTGNSINKLNFLGVAITAIANDFSTISTITVAPPGNDTEILFKDAGDFATSSAFIFDDSTDDFKVGVGGTLITSLGDGRVGFNSSAPERRVDIIGDLKLSGTIYDVRNREGDGSNILTRVNSGGLNGIEWIPRDSFRSGAAGTTGNIQFKGTDQLLDAVIDFTFDKSNVFVGIGSTVPRARLDILSPKGSVLIGPLLRSTTSSKDNGIQFFDAVGSYSNIDSAVYTEGQGRFINLGINASQVGIRTTNRVGGILRIDTRLPSDPDVSPFPTFGNTNSFVLKAVSIGDTDSSDEYNALVTNLDTGNTYLSPEKGAVAIGTEVISQKLNIAGYGRTDNGIRIGDMHLFAFSDSNPDTKGSPTFKNLNTNGHSVLRVIPSGTGNSQIECFTQDYFANISAWDNFRIYTTPTYVRLDTSSATGSDGKPISIETNVGASGTTRPNPGQVYLKTDGNVGINTEDPQYTLDVNGDLRLRNRLYDSQSLPGDGGTTSTLVSVAGTNTLWRRLDEITIGKASEADSIRSSGISSDRTYYLGFVEDNNNTSPFFAYENFYTASKLEFNPTQGLTLGSLSDLNVGIGLTIIGIGSHSSDDKARIKIGNNFWNDANRFTAFHAKKLNTELWIEQNSEDSDGPDLVSYKSRGTPGNESPVQLGDNLLRITARSYKPGRTGKGESLTLSDWADNNSQISFDVDDGPSGSSSISFRTGGTNNTRLHIKSDGKVGVGTFNPRHTLEVFGDLFVTGFVYDSDGDKGIDGQLFTSTNTGTNWRALSDTTVGVAISLRDTKSFSISGDGFASAVGFNGTQNVGLALTLSNIPTLSADTYGNNLQVPQITIDSKGRITQAQNVAIGTVGNAERISTGTTNATTPQYLTFVNDNNSSGRQFEFLYTDNALTWDPDSNRLGIGTSNPQQKLDVFGDIRIVDVNPQFLMKETGVTNEPVWSWVADGGNFNLRLNNAPPYFFNVNTNGTNDAATEVRITPFDQTTIPVIIGGNVGIGSATPTNKLDVNGNIVPSVDNAYDLGTSALKWRNAYIENLVVEAGGTDIEFDTLVASLRANNIITGGGTITRTGNRIKFDRRFIVISNGRGTYFSTNGFFNIEMPTEGTTIDVLGTSGQTTTTTNADGIELNSWQALYYILPIGSSNTSIDDNFRVVGYNTGTEVIIPANWVLIAYRNSDSQSEKLWVIGKYGLKAGESVNTSLYDGVRSFKTGNLLGGASGSIPYQSGTDTTTFLADPDASNRVLSWNDSTNVPEWKELGTIEGAGYNLTAVDSGTNVTLRLSDGTNQDDVTITAGNNITIDPVAAGGFTIAAANNVASADDLNFASADNQLVVQLTSNNTDLIARGSTQDQVLIYNTSGAPSWKTLSSIEGAGYNLTAVDSGNNVILRLSDGTTNDDVTITAGNNITIDPVAAGGFTISASDSVGTATTSTELQTVQNDVGNDNYLTFVKTNSTTPTSQQVYTNPNLNYDAGNDSLKLNGTKLLNYREVVSDLGSGVNINVANGNVFTKTLSSNTTFTFTGGAAYAGSNFTLILTNSGAGRAITWPGSVRWAGGTAPVKSDGDGLTDVWVFITPDGTNWYGSLSIPAAS